MILSLLFLVLTLQGWFQYVCCCIENFKHFDKVGVSSVELTCGGCESEENAPGYYCHGISRYLSFRCESDSSTLIWNVSPLLEEPVVLGALSTEGNVIRRDGATIIIDTLDFSEDRRQIISYLWLDLGLLDSDVTVSCSSGHPSTWTMKLLGSYTILFQNKNFFVKSWKSEWYVICRSSTSSKR